jgi:hypothetical protein
LKKNIRTEKAVVQVIEHMPSKCQALSSNSSTGKRDREREREERRERLRRESNMATEIQLEQ